jgi:hemerythrin superfamily protein
MVMKIYDALKKDHEEVKELFADLLSLRDDDVEERKDIVKQIRDALIPHSRAEEAVFYNSIRAIDSGKSEVMHSYNEHMMAETLLRALQLETKVGAGWRSTAEKLREALDHHIQEEETKLFSAGRRLFTDDEAEMMGNAFENMKPEIREEGLLGTTVDMVKNLMPPRLKDKFTPGQSRI